MYLKSIEINGFKSFANRIVFKFNNGITGIVGPNGSGKSNVGDAVRWVLGEQSAKQLRGSKMEDVIFSGTELRKPQGFAYVAITLDNSDHKLPIDYNEVTVARRVYRSGESEYLINGVVSRLKDVNSLFFDTGIGKEGYSIIGQGQIERILSGKPEERRELFDEAAGIVKYKKNKATTEKSLESERENLARVNDILRELERQVGPLKEQYETARKYLIFKDELKKLDNSMAQKRFEAMGNRDATVIEAEGLAKARELQGYTWQQEQQFNVSRTFAQNEGFAANPANMMAQIPLAFSMGDMMKNSVNSSMEAVQGQPAAGQSVAGQPAAPVESGMSAQPAEASLAGQGDGITCVKCGAVLPKDAKFCFQCGEKVEVPQKIFCSNCGTEMQPEANFCTKCGTRRE